MNKPGSIGYYNKKMQEVSKVSKPKKPVALPEPVDIPIVEEEIIEVIESPDYEPVISSQLVEKKVPWVLIGVVGLGLILAFSSEK